MPGGDAVHVIVDAAPCPAGDGADSGREVGSRSAADGQLLQLTAGRGIGQLDSLVGREHQQAGPAVVAGGRAREQGGPAQAAGHRVGQRRCEAHVGGREVRSPGLAQQGERPQVPVASQKTTPGSSANPLGRRSSRWRWLLSRSPAVASLRLAARR